MTRGGWEQQGHTADVRLRLWGPDAAAVYDAAVRALAEVVLADAALPPPHAEAPVDLEGTDPADLLVCVCNEALYLLERGDGLTVGLRVDRVTDTRLAGRLQLARVTDPARLQDVKAATYSELRWARTDHGWTAELTLDL